MVENSKSEIKDSLNKFKLEVANELGVDLKDENLTSYNAGRVGGEMTKRLVEQAKKSM